MAIKFVSRLTTLLKSSFKTSGSTLKNILVLVLVFGLERIFEKDIFKCPRRKYFLYGSLFLFCPAVCLFSLTLLLNTKFWEVLTGCHLNRFRPRWVLRRASSITVQAILPAGVWIVVALVQTNYYVCARLGPKEAALRNAITNANGTLSSKEIKLRIENLFSEAETESHIIAWILFVSIITLAFFAVCIRRCWFRRADGDLLEMEEYDELEAKAAVEYLTEKMKELAKEEGEKYVEDKLKEKEENEGERRNWVSGVRDEVARMYPRMTGNLSEPYKAAAKEKDMETTIKYEVETKTLQGKMNGIIESAL
ncbi:calcium homeostasis modulator protein 6-like [Actinia tenebrosa]|uniref:Calcium homeostasis modulator protein 6-like n=1 Tax=Actinia tenebrosa TaxID=6105 RepID=A0A6P8I7G1_ACTTE|nr:calcium homeostasis modulator protein 6-like [Actinia tenebrosa]